MVVASEQARAAVPAYLGDDFREAAPGHRFYLYLRLWDRSKQWQKVNGGAANDLVRLTDDDRARMKALAARQQALADEADIGRAAAVVALPARSEAPFTTGLGIEHPLENGFAFLSPYGLPYLPGSSVKGVLRQAARELDADGAFEKLDRIWGRADIDALFGTAGRDGDDGSALDRRRGALAFWDVFPVLPESADLQWEVMSPHHSDYYQDPKGLTPPHDNGAPMPINFLTVPVGSRFRFIVQCNRALLDSAAPHLLEDNRWQTILHELFEHAFAWLGFGAKTAVGYGEMAVDKKAMRAEEERRRRQKADEEREAQLAEMPPGERLAARLLEGKKDPKQAEYKYLLECVEAGQVPDKDTPAFARVVLEWLEKRREEVKQLKDKKKRRTRLEEIDTHEQRLKAYPQGDHDHQNH